MRRTGIIAALLGELLLILSACGSPAITATTTPAPVAVPASTTPAAAEIAVVSEPAYPLPAPAPAPAPGQWNFVPDLVKYIVEVTPASGQGGFLLSRLQVYPIEAAVGDNVTFSVMVTNTGGQTGTYTVALKFDDAIIQTQDVTIDANGSKKVEFDIMAEYSEFYGEFKVLAGELTAGFRVFF